MQYKFRIVDKLSALSELDRYQVESIAWLRLASFEEGVRRVCFRITPQFNPKFECQYRAEWVVELASGRMVTTRLSKITVGAAVIQSAQEMSEKVSRRIAFERSWMFRICNAARETLSRSKFERGSAGTANCSQTMA